MESELRAITDGEGEALAPIGAAPYGRADRAAAYMVLANLYLNAPSTSTTRRRSSARTP